MPTTTFTDVDNPPLEQPPIDQYQVARLEPPPTARRSQGAPAATADSAREGAPPALVDSGAARESEVDEDHRTNLARFKVATAAGLAVCALFVAVDWLVVTYIYPSRLTRYLEWRAVIAFVLVLGCGMTLRKPAISVRTLRTLDLVVFSTTSAMITLMCVEFAGITSPYYAGVSLVLVCRAAAIPTNWRAGLLYFGLPAAMFPLLLLGLAPFDGQIAAQFHDSHARSLFLLNVIFVGSGLFLVIIGSHAVWSLRRELYASRSLGRYRLERRIGQGGMGEVWRAHHSGLKRDVAVKILRPSDTNRQAGVARFEREVAATVRLTHPHTVRVFDHGVTVDGLWYYAMELLEGQDLRALVHEVGPLPAARVVALMSQAARALAEAHQLGIVHRDVKPANLFITNAGGEPDFVKVLDFGIAKMVDSDAATLTHTGWLGGTPDYMSPEVIMGRGADARADVYSLGAVMYFALTGSPPFRAGSIAELLSAHVNRPAIPLSDIAGCEPGVDLENVVMRCLSKEPDERFADGKELAAALAGCELPPIARAAE